VSARLRRWTAVARAVAPVVALVIAIAWLYGDPIRGLVVQWATSPDASYGAILAVVGALLLWQRRDRICPRTPAARSGAIAGLPLIAGLALYLAGFAAADVFTTRASLVLVVGGLLWYLYGTSAAVEARTPLLFILLSIPLPEIVVTTLTGSLQTVAARTAEALLTTAGIPVYRDGNVLELPTSTLQVVEACSGLRSVVSLAAVGVLIAWASSGDARRRAALIVSTIPIAVLVNGVRLAASGAASEQWGSIATREPWHSFAGWLTFVASLSALWLARRVLLPTPFGADVAEGVRA
jgi:exosortase